MTYTYFESMLQKIYNELLIDRRQLTNLKRTINRTLQEIKCLDKLFKQSRLRRESSNQGSPSINPAQPIENSIINNISRIPCSKCKQKFLTKQELQAHISRNHGTCLKCNQKLQESQQEHQKDQCSMAQVNCQGCKGKIKRKVINQHIKWCSYRHCHKCDEEIYYKAFQYHLRGCKKKKSLITRCKVLPKHIETQQLSVLPCSMIL